MAEAVAEAAAVRERCVVAAATAVARRAHPAGRRGLQDHRGRERRGLRGWGVRDCGTGAGGRLADGVRIRLPEVEAVVGLGKRSAGGSVWGRGECMCGGLRCQAHQRWGELSLQGGCLPCKEECASGEVSAHCDESGADCLVHGWFGDGGNWDSGAVMLRE